MEFRCLMMTKLLFQFKMEVVLPYITMMTLSLTRIGPIMAKAQILVETFQKHGMFKIITLKTIVVPMVKTSTPEVFLVQLT